MEKCVSSANSPFQCNPCIPDLGTRTRSLTSLSCLHHRMNIWAAVESGDLDLVKSFIDRPGIDLNAQDKDGRSAVECAVTCGHDEILAALLNGKASADLENSQTEWTPIMYAANWDYDQGMKLLVKHGASVNTRHGPEGLNAVLIVCRNGSAEGLGTLLLKGAVTQISDKEGRTPLHYAVASGNVELVSLLLQHHADPDARDKHGNVALERTSELYTAATNLFVPNGPKVFYKIINADCPEINGTYQMHHDDHYQRVGSAYALIRDQEERLWRITDGTKFIVRSLDAAHQPDGVQSWSYRDSSSGGKFSPASNFSVRELTVMNAGCDECKVQNILGPAYFCSVRYDFDLCEECEKRQIQPFPMVKYYENWQRPWKFVYDCHITDQLHRVPTYHFDPRAVHDGVTCSACQMSPIVGARFISAVRPDYNLCSACEASTADKDGAHPHAMIKIYDPKHHPKHIEYTSRRENDGVILECAPLQQLPQVPVDAEAVQEEGSDPVLVEVPVPARPSEQRPLPPRAVPPPTVQQYYQYHPATSTSTSTTSSSSSSHSTTPSTTASTPAPRPQYQAARTVTITCASVPALNATYVKDSEDSYQAQGECPNMLIKHPVDGVWCVSDGNRFLAMAVNAAAEPNEVQQWKCFAGKGFTKCSDIMVSVVR